LCNSSSDMSQDCLSGPQGKAHAQRSFWWLPDGPLTMKIEDYGLPLAVLTV